MRRGRAATLPLAALALLAAPVASAAASASGGAAAPEATAQVGGASPAEPLPSPPAAAPPAGAPGAPGALATLSASGRARAPRGAPPRVRRVIAAGNRIQGLPYRYGGGHASFKDTAYDCSGSVSYALHGGSLLASPLDSLDLASWGQPGRGRWITVYTNPRHAFLIVAGLRLDTSGTGGSGPRWHTVPRSTAGFAARHPADL